MAVNVDIRDALRAIARAPFVRAGGPFILGVALGAAFHLPWAWVLLSCAAITVFTVIRLWSPITPDNQWQRGALLVTWFFSAGLARQVIDDAQQGRSALPNAPANGVWMVRVDAVNGNSARVFRADAELLARMDSLGTVPVRGTIMLSVLLSDSVKVPRVGDRLFVHGTLGPIVRVPDPGGYDRRAWAATRGITHELFAPEAAWVVHEHRGHWTEVFTRSRDAIEHWLEGSALALRERALVKALVLGQRDELDSEQRDAFARSGTIHVLAVSGMHVGLIFGALTFLLSWLGKGRMMKLLSGTLILAALWAYAGLTGASPSVLRATVMFSVFAIAEMRQQRTDHLNSLFIAAMVLLLWDPTMLHQAGFQLSFLAVLGIILFYRPLERLWMPRAAFWRGVRSLLVVSLAAQLLTTPLSLYLFKAFPIWFLPANVVIVTAVGVAVNGAIALLFLYKVPVLGSLLTAAMTVLLKSIGLVTSFFASLPGAYPDVRIGASDMVVLYILVLAVAAWWQWRWHSMRWVTLMATAWLFTGWAIRAHGVMQRNTFTVYDDRGSLSAAMVQGRQLAVLAASDSLAPEDRIWQRMERHRKASGAVMAMAVGPARLHGPDPFVCGAAVMAGGRWLSHAFDVHFVDAGLLGADRDLEPPADVIVFHALPGIDRERARSLLAEARQVVLAARVGYQARSVIKELCSAQAIPVHDVRDHGAFVLER